MDIYQLTALLQQINYSRLLIYLPTLISTYYIFCKGLNIKFTKKETLYLSVCTILISGIIMFTEYSYNMHSRILTFALPSIALIILNRKSPVFVSLPTAIISVGITYCAKIVSYLICAIMCVFIGSDSSGIVWGVFIAVLQTLLCVLLMKVKRFKNGFSFFKDKNHSDIGLVLSGGVLFVAVVLNNKEYVSISILPTIFLTLALISFGIFMWIKRSINQKYLNNLQKKELTKYEAELAEKQDYIDNLLKSNTALAKIVHRDNHLFSALNYTIKQQLEHYSDNHTNNQLFAEILTMLKERSDLVLEEQLSNKLLPTTDIALIDGAIGNMLISCISHKIDFDVTVQCKPTYIVDKVISQTNLETLLCDHIKDAIIAVNSSKPENGKILLKFDMKNGIYEITIKDNGCEFTINTLAKLGLESITTHKDTGGTGMGFLTTFKTLKDCKASLIITEYKSSAPFSKAVSFRFDGNNSFVINSYRAKELSEHTNRTDILINTI